MTEREIESKAISEILKETEIIKERNKPPVNGFCINKRLLSRNLVSTLRDPVFPRNLLKRRIIGLDDETEDESDADDNRKKCSNGRNFADDDFIYDARDYFNPDKYREIVAFRNKKRQKQECYERKRPSGYVGDSIYMPDVRKSNYHDDALQFRELQDYGSEEHEGDAVDEKISIKLLEISGTSMSVDDNTNDAVAYKHKKRKRHKSKSTHTQSQQKKHSKKSKHRQNSLECMTQKVKVKKCRKCKKDPSHCIRKARHKKKKAKKKKESAYASEIEFEELNQRDVEDISKFRSDCLGSTSPYSSYYGNEDSGTSAQHSLGYNDELSNHRLGEGDCDFKAEQFVNESEVSHEGHSLVSAKYLNELYFRTRQNSDNG